MDELKLKVLGTIEFKYKVGTVVKHKSGCDKFIIVGRGIIEDNHGHENIVYMIRSISNINSMGGQVEEFELCVVMDGI